MFGELELEVEVEVEVGLGHMLWCGRLCMVESKSHNTYNKENRQSLLIPSKKAPSIYIGREAGPKKGFHFTR